jgi:ATP-dependent Clp protease ATP-binding subunit ClpA
MSFVLFTDRSRMTVVAAQAEAAELGHTTVGPEHLLAGLLRVANGVAWVVLTEFGVNLGAVREKIAPADSRPESSQVDPASALAAIGIDLSAVREAIEASFGKGALRGAPLPKFTPQAHDVLRGSGVAASELRHRYIGTEHLLLGLLRERESPGC